jgi:hypothetical protein
MATKHSLEGKQDSSADHIDDVETQQERVLSTQENNVGTSDQTLNDAPKLTFHRDRKSMYSTRRRRNGFSERSTFA